MSAQLPEEIYATFVGPINDDALRRFFAAFPTAVNGGVKKVHLLLQSGGGNVGDGVSLYNYLSSLPLEIVTYNTGFVGSIAVTAFLAGKERKATGNSTFLLHKTTFTFQGGSTAELMRVRAEAASLDDKNIEAIFAKHFTVPKERWAIRDHYDLILSADEAKSCGLVHSIGDFSPPKGCQLYNI
jgi:ATP-dependent Clp protease protease subunit